ncbi:type 1 glutamine amidotransferase domain-containing protein [Flavobacterium sp. J27]|uniref:type 1 glutamine amidotransferase domain-containing protein n=1 Tax=Flavobacterium sp. J27 TaxID=2060419 RepID=UPI0010317ADF|nr:type 1 glutamine amidotransferase domain-containing protein [Flavobacterium sp. J27]
MKKKIAILATNGFEEIELTSPRKALEKEGWKTEIVSPESGSIKAWASTEWGKLHPVDKTLREAHHSDYDALVLPGGVINPDQLRTNTAAVQFVQHFFEKGKPVAAICHGPQTLISAQVVAGRKMTSYPSIKQDLINAGAEWYDKEVVVDKGLVTSRKPDDLPAFNKKMIEEIKEGKHDPVR